MRIDRVAGCFFLALLLVACQSEQKKTEQAREKAKSFIAGIGLTCQQWRQGLLPARFAQRAVADAQEELQKVMQQLPASEQTTTRAAAARAACLSGSVKS